MARDIGKTLLKIFFPQQSSGLRLLLAIPYIMEAGGSWLFGIEKALVIRRPESTGSVDTVEDLAYIRVAEWV